ncbi:unnamed protein product [Strongylus vulgaris]|uniref:Uncharacterized protein n=1 Tax=Strongylus vulgaris TaxID=40348 RepID=A0A3P7J105_STRVU|nr:unnamed protein product [Strongylus vulgaris]
MVVVVWRKALKFSVFVGVIHAVFRVNASFGGFEAAVPVVHAAPIAVAAPVFPAVVRSIFSTLKQCILSIITIMGYPLRSEIPCVPQTENRDTFLAPCITHRILDFPSMKGARLIDCTSTHSVAPFSFNNKTFFDYKNMHNI